MVKPCNCINEYQDKKYGKGLRVHTPVNSKKNGTSARCTVCGTTK